MTNKGDLWPARRGVSAAAAAFLGLLSSGCVTPVYTYRPTEDAGVTVSGLPAARYPLPPEQPAGTVRVASPGVEEIPTEDGGVPALRARLVVINESEDAPWTLDVREIHAELGPSGAQHPAFVNAAAEDLPILSVSRGGERTVDVFFWLPEDAPDEESLPSFALRWKVHTRAGQHEARTRFERVEIVDAPPPPAVAHAPYWWYDPLFYGSPFHMGGPFGPAWYWGAGFSFGATWHAPLLHPVPPVFSPGRIPATPRILPPGRMRMSPGFVSPGRSFGPSFSPGRGLGGPRGRR